MSKNNTSPRPQKIHLRLNGETREVEPSKDLAALLGDLRLAEGSVAVELNGRIVEKPRYAETRLAEGDVLEIVHFVGGG
jgi:thiamine biosynthesis protein ThiS